MTINGTQLSFSLISNQLSIFYLDHSCATGYTLSARNQVCDPQAAGSTGEVNLGGPNWPSASSTEKESEEACAAACNARSGCTQYIWFADKGCRTQTDCSQTVSSGQSKSFVCKKGILSCYLLGRYNLKNSLSVVAVDGKSISHHCFPYNP